MHPAFSVVAFTTLAGAAQGLVVALAVAGLRGTELPRPFVLTGLSAALVMLIAGLIASMFHLGRPERAWRAVLMWRTSWLSREVIVLPAFIAVVALWLFCFAMGAAASALQTLMILALVLCALLWLCTAMIYACLKFIQEWAHPLTLVNYVLLGLASGLVLAAALAGMCGADAFAVGAAKWGLIATIAGAVTRIASLVRNAALRPKSTLQTATGIQGGNLRQTAMGMSAGAFNTREFFHGKPLWLVRRVKHAFVALAFVVPAVLLVLALNTGASVWLVLAVLVQFSGLLAERWFFFAQAKHPQNLYYQVVS